jgi:hypothetical protein
MGTRDGAIARMASWLLLLTLAGCGGGSKSAVKLTVTCGDGTEVIGAMSVDVPGELANGRATLNFPDPTNPGKTGSIAIQPGKHCKIVPAAGG